MQFDDVPAKAKQRVLWASVERLFDEFRGTAAGIIFPYITRNKEGAVPPRWMAQDQWLIKEVPPVGYTFGEGIPPDRYEPEVRDPRYARTTCAVLFIKANRERFAEILASPKWHSEYARLAGPTIPLVGALHLDPDGMCVRFQYQDGAKLYSQAPLKVEPVQAFLSLAKQAEGNSDWLFFKFDMPPQNMCHFMMRPGSNRVETCTEMLIDLCMKMGRYPAGSVGPIEWTTKTKPALDAARADLTEAVKLTGEDRRRLGRDALLRLYNHMRGFYFVNKHGKQSPYRRIYGWSPEFYRIAADADDPDCALSAVKKWLTGLGVKDRWPEIAAPKPDSFRIFPDEA